jgi:hypothetical protein
MELTPEIVGNSFVLVIVTYIIAFGFQIYMMYLNWKQSQVNNQMSELLEEVKHIRKKLDQYEKKK